MALAGRWVVGENVGPLGGAVSALGFMSQGPAPLNIRSVLSDTRPVMQTLGTCPLTDKPDLTKAQMSPCGCIVPKALVDLD